MKEVIFSKKAPAPIGPYSQAIKKNGFLFISGQIAIDPNTNELVSGNIQQETQQVMKNLHEILKSAGLDFGHVVKCSIFLSDMSNFGEVNNIYGQYFADDPPARETMAVKTLPKNVNIEISAIAAAE
jgi:2-iminobutanoate/2-iminopropanoate deaminase